jgi:hypothetical protein
LHEASQALYNFASFSLYMHIDLDLYKVSQSDLLRQALFVIEHQISS